MDFLLSIGLLGRLFLGFVVALLVEFAFTNLCAYFGLLGPEGKRMQDTGNPNN